MPTLNERFLADWGFDLRVNVTHDSILTAVYSDDGQYRYLLDAHWAIGPRLHFLLHNPSTATELKLDPTLHACRALAKAHGYGGMSIGNRLAGGRSANPDDCNRMDDPRGPRNDISLRVMWSQAAAIVVGWGNCPIDPQLAEHTLRLLRTTDKPIYCLGLTQAGNPKHPGAQGRHRVSPATPLIPYTLPEESHERLPYQESFA